MSAVLLHFEDVTVGSSFALGPYGMTADEIRAFASQFDPQPFHLDEAAATGSILGGLAASGWHTSAALMRMLCDAFLCKAATMGSPGIDEMNWLAPVFAGDVLSGAMRVTALRRSKSRPEIGIVSFEADLANQHGVAKAKMRSVLLMKVRQP